MQKKSQVEIFCGLGGVGKSTLSAARALALADAGQKVLLITIDPAKRIKDFIPEEKLGAIEFMIMDPRGSFEKFFPEMDPALMEDNRIFEVLMGPSGGLVEIMGVLELLRRQQEGGFDTIVLDTAPGPYFLHFIHSLGQFDFLMNRSFLHFFYYLKTLLEKFSPERQRDWIFKLLRGRATKLKFMLKPFGGKNLKILEVLEDLTNVHFLWDFISTMKLIYLMRERLMEYENWGEFFLQGNLSWFVVGSRERGVDREFDHINEKLHQVLDRAAWMREASLRKQRIQLVVNKSTVELWKEYGEGAGGEASFESLREVDLEREGQLEKCAERWGMGLIRMRASYCRDAFELVGKLAESWNQINL